MIDAKLLEYCNTDQQRDIVQRRLAGQTVDEIAKGYDIAVRNVYGILARLKNRAAKQGYSPEHNFTKTVPEPHTIKGISTYYDADGEVRGQWVKTRVEADIANIDEIIQAMSDEIPRVKKTAKPNLRKAAKDRLNAYIFGDSHVNMMAWSKEVGKGNDWDVSIAVQQHQLAIQDLIQRAPEAEIGVLATMGDLLHNDSLKAVTPGSGNLLDVDGRMGKARDAVILMLRSMIDTMLNKYKKVFYICVRGNHSETLELMISKMIEIAYENEPRLTVLDNTPKHIPFSWGKNFMLFTHGERLSEQKKADIVTSQFREQHGNAKFSHVLAGHLHHSHVKELSGCLVETFPALPKPDAWHYENGFVTADQSATVITYHKDGGISERTISNPRIFMGGK